MFNKHSFQVKMVKDSTEPAPTDTRIVFDISQIISDENRKAFGVLFAAYASVKLLNTACKVALIAAAK